MLQNRLCVCDGTGRLLQEMIIAGIPIPCATQFVLVYPLPLLSYQLPPTVRLVLRELPLFAGATSC